MTGLAVLGGCALVLLIPLIAALSSIYNAYWAAKVWAILVVPVFHWPALPLAGAVGIALTLSTLRPRTTEPTDKDKSAMERVSISVITMLLLGPLAYLVALVAAKVFL